MPWDPDSQELSGMFSLIINIIKGLDLWAAKRSPLASGPPRASWMNVPKHFWKPQLGPPATARPLQKVFIRIHGSAAVRKTHRSCSLRHRPTSRSSTHPTEYRIWPVSATSNSFFSLFTLASYYIIANGHVSHYCALHVNHKRKCHGN